MPTTTLPPVPASIEDIQKMKGQTILACLSNGLSETDALTLAEWTVEDFELFKKNNSRFSQLVERKKVEYKETLMKPITEAIKKGDAKMAQWMLERQFQGEFSNKVKRAEEDTNPIGVIINLIQSGKEGSSLLPNSRTLSEIIRERQEATAIIPVAHKDITNEK